MTTYNPELVYAIKKALIGDQLEEGVDVEEQFEGGDSLGWELCELSAPLKTDLGYVKCVAQPMYEGDSASMAVVISLTKDQEITYWRLEGYHDSWAGSEWENEDLFQVWPHEVTSIVYTTDPSNLEL